MTYRVRTLPRAEADIHSIANYIHLRSPAGASNWVSALDQALKRLADFAQGSGEADENEFFDIEVKQSFFRTRRSRIYRLLFTIVENEVRVLRVRGSGQAPIDPEEL